MKTLQNNKLDCIFAIRTRSEEELTCSPLYQNTISIISIIKYSAISKLASQLTFYACLKINISIVTEMLKKSNSIDNNSQLSLWRVLQKKFFLYLYIYVSLYLSLSSYATDDTSCNMISIDVILSLQNGKWKGAYKG